MEKRLMIDGHADILYRMETEALDFYRDGDVLQLSYDRMTQAGIDLQVFALWVQSKYTPADHLRIILGMIDAFYERIVRPGQFQPVLKKGDLAKNLAQGVKSGLLSIEGGECLQSDIRLLRRLYQLGVRAMGLTWNPSNCIADGVLAPEDRGLTPFGREVVQEMNRLGMVVDVAHVAPKGFWDVMELSTAPVINSHANAQALCGHKRNMSDEQLKAIFQKGGTVGMTFVPYFVVSDRRDVYIADLMRHIDHILALGGEDHLALGSDFDGIDNTMVDLRHGGDYPALIEEIVKAYGETVAKKIMGENFRRVLDSVLKE